jgi:DNA-binding CsgD family transcriptional regulator
MSTSITLPDSDLSALVRLIEDARHDKPGDVVPWALLQGLDQLIRSDSVQLTDLDWVDESLVASQYLDSGERGVVPPNKDEDTAAYFQHCRDFLPCGQPVRPADDVQAVRWSDFYTDLELRNTEAYCCYFQTIRTCLAVRLTSPPGRARRVLFMRESTRDFTDHDVMVLSLLRPHLHEIFLDAERRRTGVPKLTAREWEILQLAGDGLPNGAIGQRLFIAPATVRKHMEHILERLGVHSRTEAAAIALPHRP